MTQLVQQPFLNMEIVDNCASAQHLVGVDKVGIYLIKVGPLEDLMVTRVYRCGECRDWRSAEATNELVVTSCFILDVEVELLQICGTLLMAIILQFALCLHELHRLMISVDDCLLLENVMPPLAAGLYNGVHFFVVSRVLTDDI
jgi:hypothetical protein